MVGLRRITCSFFLFLPNKMEETNGSKPEVVARHLNALLVGDELGLLRRVDLDNQLQSTRIRTLNRDSLPRASPEHAILTIRPFDRISLVSPGYHNSNCKQLQLITSRDRKLHLYDPITDRLVTFDSNRPDGQIVGAAPFSTNHIVICYADGAIYIQNVERQMIQLAHEPGTENKALKVLGFDEKGTIACLSLFLSQTKIQILFFIFSNRKFNSKS